MKQDILRNELRSRKRRMTAQRELILRVFLETEDDHLSAEEVYRKILDKRLRISKATVYRTVDLLAEVGLLRKIAFRDGVVRYEVVEKDKHQHHHLICNNCGKVVEFPYDLLDELEHIAEKKTGFEIDDHQVKFYGLCPECLKKKKKEQNKEIETDKASG
ncbi:MAG: Fur family transcriptional regulator [Kosmotogaceae bacterium]